MKRDWDRIQPPGPLPGMGVVRMALWRIEVVGDRITLTYQDSVFPGGSAPKQCGEGAIALLADLEAWVASEAAGWDLLLMAGGTFVKVAAPGLAFSRA